EKTVAEVKAVSELDIQAQPEAVLQAVADYDTVRPTIFPDDYRDSAVVQGGAGDRSVVRWTVEATQKRVRYSEAAVGVRDEGPRGGTVTETDASSTLVTTWTVRPVADATRVTIETTWAGAGGIGGVFEGIFAPKGMQKIQDQTLANLAARMKKDQ